MSKRTEAGVAGVLDAAVDAASSNERRLPIPRNGAEARTMVRKRIAEVLAPKSAARRRLRPLCLPPLALPRESNL